MADRNPLPVVAEADRTPLVEQIEQWVEETLRQRELIQQSRDENAVLNGEKWKPKFKPSRMEKQTDPSGQAGDGTGMGRRPGSAKRHKTAHFPIHETVVRPPEQAVPQGSRFKVDRDVVVQDLRITARNTRDRLEVWQTPTGERLVGALPASQQGGHVGTELRRDVRYQHPHCQVPQPLLYEPLREWGIDMSEGTIDALLSGHTSAFLAEQNQVLTTGLAVSRWITVDDSGARHQGHNGDATQIGNDWFAWFASTSSKRRINFLALLQAGEPHYTVNVHAVDYWCEEGLPARTRQPLQVQVPNTLTGTAAWEQVLAALGITGERHRRIATEGALLGGLIENGFSLDLAIISDGAGQFAILWHALGWVYAERLVHQLIPLNERHRADQERVRGAIWDLKAERRAPDPALRPVLEARFDAISTQCTSFTTRDRALKRLHGHQGELLLALERPEVVLQTNGSERDIRWFVNWRKISGGTRSDLGRQCRDAFASLKKTCRKLGVSCWDSLGDRINQLGAIPSLPDLIRRLALSY